MCTYFIWIHILAECAESSVLIHEYANMSHNYEMQ